jgi:hypothetical protein
MLYAATLFLSAFLLFSVQPLLAKYLLPWFGGTPAVWSSCMLFFQVMLLAGYGYAHLVAGRRSARAQACIHLFVLAGSLAALPILPSAAWREYSARPALYIPALLAASVGLPYFVLSSSSPLLQAWFGARGAGAAPYRLYAVSNAGSLIAVLLYPFLIEPLMPLGRQATVWAWGYAVFVAGSAACALRVLRRPHEHQDVRQTPRAAESGVDEAPGRMRTALWFLLPACGSVMLLATTNQLCQDVAVVPLLWVVPLALYLVSFVICFDSPRWYSRTVWGTALAGSLAWSCHVLFQGVFAGLGVQIASGALTLFTACMVCHGELYRLRPELGKLTAYYGVIAAGGAAGGIFVALVAPAIFNGYWEYHLALFCTPVLFVVSVSASGSLPLRRGRALAARIVLMVGIAALGVTLSIHQQMVATGNIDMARNFFGVLRVFDQDLLDPRMYRTTLMHGRIQHGAQFQAPFRRRWPTTYYGPETGVARALRQLRSGNERGLRVGFVGLGIGTLAAYGQKGDYFRFYEINPDVVRFARAYFTFLKDCPAEVDVVNGDARISMERELARGEKQQFDLLVIDAFSGDAIPVHLLTREAAGIYRAHLRQGGVMAFHVSSRYLDLVSVARSLVLPSEAATRVSTLPDSAHGIYATEWVLIAPSPNPTPPPVSPWTDTHTPLPWGRARATPPGSDENE